MPPHVPTTNSDSAARSCTLWLGGLAAGTNEAQVRALFVGVAVRGVVIRRRGWRDKTTGETVGFALVRFDSEEAAGRVLTSFPHLLLKPHRYCAAATNAAEDIDPASLLPPLPNPAAASSFETAPHPLPGMPPLAAQLEPLTISQLRQRLSAFGCADTRELEALHQRRGGRVAKKAALVGVLVRLHTDPPARFPRTVTFAKGTPIPPAATHLLLMELRGLAWPVKKRNVTAEHYLVMGVASAGQPHKVQQRHTRLWGLCRDLMTQHAASDFVYTSVAATKNFVASPHVDAQDVTVQYAIALGEFGVGGEVCVEASPTNVVVVDTRNRLAMIDGRFPHWVRAYHCGEGGVTERYSLIFYKVDGTGTPMERAVLI